MNSFWPRMFGRRVGVGLVCLLLCAYLAACGQGSGEGAAAGGPAKVYRVGTDAHYAPFESLSAQGAIQGFDVDLLNAVADRQGFKVKFVDAAWDGLFSSLQHGKLDILASSISITPPRQQIMDFSDSYFLSRQLIAVAKGQDEIRSFHDLQGLPVGLQGNTTSDALLQSLLGPGNQQIHRYASMDGALRALETGQVDAVVGDSGMVLNYVRLHRQSGVFAIEDTTVVPPEYYGFAVKKGNQALLAQIDAGLNQVRADGTYDTLYQKYFGQNP